MKAGEVCDVKGIPIYPGDLLRQLHFIGARRKRYYLYHVAVLNDGHMQGVPTADLEPSKANGGGRFWIKPEDGPKLEILHGFGPYNGISFEDRPKKRKTHFASCPTH